MRSIIQGDSYNAIIQVKISGTIVPAANINKVYFTCGTLSIKKELAYVADKQGYLMSLSPLETISIEPGSYDFDVTVVFTNTSVKTGIYEDVFEILEKHNGI